MYSFDCDLFVDEITTVVTVCAYMKYVSVFRLKIYPSN